jgi:hypothetical protein
VGASLAPMGILDDAIREHLELKRSHGASEEEVRRQEAEVFGPVRQDVAPEPAAEAASEEHAQLVTPTADEESAADAPVADEPDAVHPGDEPVPDTHDHLHPAGSDPAWREDTELFSERPEDEHGPPVAEAGGGMLEPSHVEPGPPVAPEQLHHHHHDEQHPALADHDHIPGEEHPPEPVFGHAPESPTAPPEGEDVLEETPEFLQDAPEHDRLWFEQKPPRDFDFGE